MKIGDIVIFIGKGQPLTGSYTKGLIDTYLQKGVIYTISSIHVERTTSWGEPHYKFIEKSTNGYWFPASCFRYVGFGFKYGLR